MAFDFDSGEYAWKDIEVFMIGRPLVRLLEVKYSTTQESKEIYGRGADPLDIQTGNRSYKGEIKVGQSELEALVIKVKELKPNASPVELPKFEIVVAFAKNGVVVTDIIRGVRLESFEKAFKQGDTNMEVSLPFKAVKIDYNVLV